MVIEIPPKKCFLEKKLEFFTNFQIFTHKKITSPNRPYWFFGYLYT
jgi:hypothetical protein